jgi:hypothetical protein
MVHHPVHETFAGCAGWVMELNPCDRYSAWSHCDRADHNASVGRTGLYSRRHNQERWLARSVGLWAVRESVSRHPGGPGTAADAVAMLQSTAADSGPDVCLAGQSAGTRLWRGEQIAGLNPPTGTSLSSLLKASEGVGGARRALFWRSSSVAKILRACTTTRWPAGVNVTLRLVRSNSRTPSWRSRR